MTLVDPFFVKQNDIEHEYSFLMLTRERKALMTEWYFVVRLSGHSALTYDGSRRKDAEAA